MFEINPIWRELKVNAYKSRYLCFSVIIFLLIGCVATGPQFTELAPAPQDSSYLYFYRPSQKSTETIYPTVLLNDSDVGALKAGGYLLIPLKPGNNVISTSRGLMGPWSLHWDLKKQEYEVYAVAGRRYFLKLELHNMYQLLLSDIIQVTEDTALQELKGLKLSQ
jgi:hypothetical protein